MKCFNIDVRTYSTLRLFQCVCVKCINIDVRIYSTLCFFFLLFYVLFVLCQRETTEFVYVLYYKTDRCCFRRVDKLIEGVWCRVDREHSLVVLTAPLAMTALTQGTRQRK